MRRKRIEKLLKAKILSESLKEGCVITELAKEYGVSKNTIYGWRSKYKESVPSVCEYKPKVVSPASDNKFIELSITESNRLTNLHEASLKFTNFSLVLQGQIKSSILVSIVKILEESC